MEGSDGYCFGSLWSAASSNLILDLQCGQSLVIEDLANVALVEVEVGVAEVHKCYANEKSKKNPEKYESGSFESPLVRIKMKVLLLLNIPS